MFTHERRQQLRFAALANILSIAIVSVPVAGQDTLDLAIAVEHVTAMPGKQDVTIPIYLSNCCDSIVAFQLWLVLNRPDIMQFDMTLDTVGTLVSGWPHSVTSLGGSGYDILITAGDPPPFLNAIGYPQTGDIPLLRLVADVYDIPDTMLDRSVGIMVVSVPLDHFSFSRPDGSSVGIVVDTVPDTSWFVCVLWSEPNPDSICLQWEEVSGPPADSFNVDTIAVARLDTSRVSVSDGSLTVLTPCCNGDGARGNVDGLTSAGGEIDVSDLTYMVCYIFCPISCLGACDPPPCMDEGNIDAITGPGGPIDIADLTYLVAYLFQSGPLPPACP